ncbi:uncharacterized protein LOC109721435 isoform X2 [Ananas comosus]|uniref:Uncharacterized protein LOC109721435 isoform X2 n=1 Tax=Ananas comosus TaxID=4615 RepID=A0A6P5GFC5_ANACO|nr:uncharacterized protein LOC109721435 isoform X2 [Ananas comosus]
MAIRGLCVLLRRIRFPTRSPAPSSRRFAAAAAAVPGSTCFHPFRFGFTQGKHHWDVMLGVLLSGQAAIFLGANVKTVLAEDVAEDALDGELVAGDEQGEAYVTGLRRIEDGSVISNEHTSKWRIYTDIGRDLSLKGKLDEAEKYFQLALGEAKEGFGPKDPHVASSCNNLAEIYRVRKKFEKAEPLYLEAIRILEESFGADDIRVGAALHNLGQFYLAQKKLDQARACYERSLKIKGRVLGYGHPDYAETMYHLGKVLYLQGKEKDAEALIRESIRILEEAGMGESTTCIRRMRYLSQVLLNSNRHAEAESLQRRLLHSLELSKGWESLETVIAAESLALTLQSLGNLKESQELLERCLVARRKILSEDHVQVAANFLHLARVGLLSSKHLQTSDAEAELDKARLLLDKSIRITKAILNPSKKVQKSVDTASALAASEREKHEAFIVLLQSLDAVGLLEVRRCEVLMSKESCEYPFEAELALRDCLAIFKEPHMRNILMNTPDVKAEYLSCLNRLSSIIRDSAVETERAKELFEEAQRIEAELSPRKHRKC